MKKKPFKANEKKQTILQNERELEKEYLGRKMYNTNS